MHRMGNSDVGERWKMNRMGFVNFWLYDEEIFEFENGKLLLRGQNGSGKSITTQSFIPFILDGDRTPSRLDPFGSSDRRMEYYFLGEEGKDEATGYLFLEFFKEETKEYRTIGIGQRARRGKPMDFWGFVLLDQRRIGVDLWLYKEVGSSQIPLAKNDLKKLLGEGTPFTEAPGEYKALVNKHIFGFRKMEQYEQFISLLVKVRAPKLSKEFRPSKVYDILNESLQTLTDEDLRAMVDAMEKMDAIQENLEQLSRAYSDIRIIRNEYIRYNQYMLAKKGQIYLDKKKETEGMGKALRGKEEMKAQMQEEQQEKRLKNEEITSRLLVVGTELDSLYDTDMEEVDRKLEAARKKKEEAEEQLRKWTDRIEDCRRTIQDREYRLKDLNEKLEIEQEALSSGKAELEEAQEILRWEDHRELVKLVDIGQTAAAGPIAGRLQELKRRIAEGRSAVEQYERVEREYDRIAQQLELCRREKGSRMAEEDAAQIALVDVQDALIQSFYEQTAGNAEWKLPEDVLKNVEDLLKQYQKPSDGDVIRGLLSRVFEEKRLLLTDERKEWERKLEEQRLTFEDTEEELEGVRSQAELEPERDPAVEASRKSLEEAGITGVPFFKTVEFAGGLAPEECAMLEAQLQKMGILDALVVSDRDYARIQKECPWFLDTVLHVEKKGDSAFGKLVVSEELEGDLHQAVTAILSQVYETPGKTGGIYLGAEGSFRQGILEGRADKSVEAEYVGRLARKRRKEQRIRELEEKLREIRRAMAETEQEIRILAERLERLREEYENIPDLNLLGEALERVRICIWNTEQINEKFRQQEAVSEECLERKNQQYQKMLKCCKPFPYGRTWAEYQQAWESAEEYQQTFQLIKETLMRLERYRSDIGKEKDMQVQTEEQMDEAFVEKRRSRTECDQQDILIRKYEEYLNRPEVKEQAERIAGLKKEQRALIQEEKEIEKRLAVLNDRIREILAQEEPQKQALRELIAEETALAGYFEEELALRLVFSREGEPLPECAVKAQEYLRESDRGRDAGELFNALFQVFQKYNGSLTAYGTALENCFENDGGGSPAEHPLQSLRSRVLIVSVWNGQKLYLEEFFRILKNTIDETELLIQKKDRELFEDILSQTISRQLTDRIAESRNWAKNMSALMKTIDTSMGLTFSLEWKPKNQEGELGALELEQILLRDRELLTVEDISRVASHFRGRIRAEKLRLEENGGLVNYMDLVREALDYREWFEFRMYYRKGEEQRKPLTNAAFNRFSGGEKAMAMYVPLFAAVNAQYQKAELPDHPRMIALDEAFAGVDDKNISSMFGLVDLLDFDYIMNSQALWGCYENVRGLRIVELRRPLSSRIVTPIRYTWNGQERILDVQ